MSTPTNRVVSTSDYWIRVNITLEFCVKEALIDILHNHRNDPSYTGLPTNRSKLHQHMKSHESIYQDLNDTQWSLLCPANGQTDSRKWDITLLVLVINRELTFSTNSPLPRLVNFARILRNDIKHGTMASISTLKQFEGYWNRIERILIGLKYKNMDLFSELQKATLDKYNAAVLNIVKDFKTELDSLKNEATDNTNEIQQTNNKIDVLEQLLEQIMRDLKATKIELKNEIKMEIKTEITNEINDVIDQKVSNNNSTTGKPLFWDLREPVANFHGREDVIKDMENQLHSSKTVVITAMGGCGKTQTVAKFVQTHKDKYDCVFWLTASSIQKSLDMIAKRLGCYQCNEQEGLSVLELSQVISDFKDDKKVLYVVDNVFKDDLENLRTLKRNCSSQESRILITTQLSQLFDNEANVSFISLPIFTEHESRQFLQGNLQDLEPDDIEALLSEIHNFPLCLQLVVGYLKQNGTDIPIFIESFRNGRESILDTNGYSDYDKTLLTVWQFAFDQLKESPKALRFLAIMALMDNSCIKKQTFFYDKELIKDEIELNEIIKKLYEYSLIQYNKNQLFIHSLVQKIIRIFIDDEKIELEESPVSLLKNLLGSIAKRYQNDEMHSDENDLWYIHYNKLITSHPQYEYDMIGVLKVSGYRYDHANRLNHLRKSVEQLRNAYKADKSFELFVYMIELKIELLKEDNNASTLINPTEIESFENEFKLELTQPHQIVYEWKILKLHVLITINGVVSYKKDFLSSLCYFEEVRYHSKLALVRLSLLMNDLEVANKLFKKIPVVQLPFLQFIDWHDCKIKIYIKQRNYDHAEELLNELEKTFLNKNISKNTVIWDHYIIWQRASILRSKGKNLEALKFINMCSSAFRKENIFLTIKFSILMELHRFEEARSVLPTDEECENNYNLSDCLAHFKFCTQKFDEMPKRFLHNESYVDLGYHIQVYALARNQFFERRETLSEMEKKEMKENLHLLYTYIRYEFDSMFL